MERAQRGACRTMGQHVLDLLKGQFQNVLGLSSLRLPALLHITSSFFPFLFPTTEVGPHFTG